MCGIAGIVDFAGGRVDPDVLAAAGDTMRHRGPDDAGVWTDHTRRPNVGFAATRLAVLDPTGAGHQPMSADGGRFVIVFNGLIYNHHDVRDALRREGVVLTTRCDTEAALQACVRWGPEALERFEGMWALAFYDRRLGTGFLSRDRFGIKPLVWAEHDGRLTFASEMRTLRRLGDWPDDVNRCALMHYLRFGYVGHPDTIYSCAHRLPPSTYMPFGPSSVGEPVRCGAPPRGVGGERATVGGGGGADRASTTPQDATPGTGDRWGAARRVRRALFQSVARHRLADVPIGAFLSGGLDSSIVVAHLAELSSRPIKTFSVGWSEEGAYDETRFARLVADRFGTEHHELRCRFADVVDLIPSMLDHLGEPFFDSSILPTAIVSRFARRDVTVILSGDGGDELFGGYWRYLAHVIHERYRRIPRWVRAGLIEPLVRRAASAKSSSVSNRVRQFRKLLRAGNADMPRRHIAWSEILAPEARDIVSEPLIDDPVLNRLIDETRDTDDADPLNRILAFDLRYSLPCDMLHKVDLASMACSLEVRVPFLDPDVVATAVSMPSSMKVCGGEGKVVLKDAYRGLLPDAVLHRGKMGFEVPIGEFLRGPLREMFRSTVTRDVVESFGLIRHDAVMRVYDEHCARRGEHADLLFALLSLCWWRRGQRSIK